MDTQTQGRLLGSAAAIPAAAVELRAVTRVYGARGTAVRALDHIDIAFPTGSWTAVMGPSGSGKSTLLHCAAGLERVSSGQVYVAGREITNAPDEELTRLRRTVVGRELFALGGNPNAAVLAGISRRKIQVGTYSLAGLLYGLAGLAQVGILSAATSSAGADDLLTPIAAAVIGGVSLFGGEGSVLGAGLGIIVIGLISDGLVLLNISTFYTQIVYGVVVFVAVLLDSGRRVLERRRA